VPERIVIFDGDITGLELDAIVNAANKRLAPGAGVCGAIHRAAGPELAKACAAIGRCPTGEARLTPGFDLLARYVIHTVGPVWHGGDRGESDLLAACYRNSLRLASEIDIKTIAFPALSTGIFGYPVEAAAKIATATTREQLERFSSIERVVFCCFGRAPTAIYRQMLSA
jgi:O-acetyl-ADP-ribose deacetylase (regulator of RNase III)